jgi:hypothetical protein
MFEASRSPILTEVMTMTGTTRSFDPAGSDLRNSATGQNLDENPPIIDNFGQTVDFEGNPTVTYRPSGELPTDLDDGFPLVDDLTGGLLGQYKMGPVIGYGSMARVYQAEHQYLCRPCAIKVLNPGLVARQPQIREQFWAEARVVANLVHPHVARGRASIGSGASRRQAGQRPAHDRGPSQARRFRAGPPPLR